VTEAPQRRAAAVLMAIYDEEPHDVIFIRRAHHLRYHAGQIAFPGGGLDEQDGGDLTRAALRETEEEIGVAPAAVRIVGQLRNIVQTRNIYTVTPFVGIIAARTPLIPDQREVAAIHLVPLTAILEPGAVHAGQEQLRERIITTSQFDHDGLHVWGLTAEILRDFVETYTGAESPLRAAVEGALR
jgi:8-oxo-dGTP pyrophosphatase MutT (NUDIX family)